MANTYDIRTKEGFTTKVRNVVGIGFDVELGTVALFGDDNEHLAIMPIANVDVIVKEDA